ncbi:aminotransferase class I/II-fold pyridoxal phosphate-dependent enzyme [Streptomyces sp. SID8358]|uniref:MocR-like pyridoxine biosynthesis transcription factor PdxR n=1 Tax=Streptomyces sp. SID8358 TaxID=2690342 RepID=UPI000DAC33D3|nr:aminotransferase class I/II-fold pyridoxal phosphate-dependent enzyme [Streptomyces sp. SID8358]
MVDHGSLAWATSLDLDREPGGPLHTVLRRALRSAVVSGRLAAGSVLPPSRTLAADLGCSRWVVTEAYAQLIAEGYLEARSGSGTRVRVGAVPPPGAGPARPKEPRPAEFDMTPGVPDLRAFPRKRWADAVRDAVAAMGTADLGYPDASGHALLRRELAAYLVRGRAASATPESVVVCGGTQDAVVRLCTALRHEGHTRVAVEDPGWTRLRSAIETVGLEAVPVPVDDGGLQVDRLAALAGVRAVVVAPAHQFPTGSVLSPPRRAELVDWARRVDGLVVEDDYDAEFRHGRRPVGVVQGMDHDRVALLGSVSKTLAPALRLGWMCAPRRWADAIAGAVPGFPPPVVEQLAYASFLRSGAYDRHIRASRLRYRRRRDLLVEELGKSLPGCRISGEAAGFHLLLHLPDDDEAGTVRRAEARGVRLAGLGEYRVTDGHTGGALVLGYGNLADAAVPGAVRALAEAVGAPERGRAPRRPPA